MCSLLMDASGSSMYKAHVHCFLICSTVPTLKWIKASYERDKKGDYPACNITEEL